MKYPGRVIKQKETNKTIVKAVQKQLNIVGCGPIDVDGDYGKNTANAIKLFQARNADQHGDPLAIDGKIGPITWAILFGQSTVPTLSTPPKKTLNNRALEIAISQIGVREQGGANRGPQVKEYLKSVGLNEGFAWCAAFLYWCYEQAAEERNVHNPLVKTGGVLKSWNEAVCKKIKGRDAINNPALVKPGQIFCMKFSATTGHTGIVKSIEGGFLTTIEGNSNNGGSREGVGVFELKKRKIKDINLGFLEY